MLTAPRQPYTCPCHAAWLGRALGWLETSTSCTPYSSMALAVMRAPSWAIWVRTWRRTATSTRLRTVRLPAASRYCTTLTPSRSSLRTARCSARSAVEAPEFTRAMASVDADRNASRAPCSMCRLSRCRMAASPRTVASIWRGHALSVPGLPRRSMSSASDALMNFSTVARSSASTSPAWLSMMRRSSSAWVWPSSAAAVTLLDVTPPPDSMRSTR